MNGYLFSLVVVFLGLSLNCGKNKSNSPTSSPVNDTNITSIEINPKNATIQIDSNIQYIATVKDDSGNILGGIKVNWISEDTTIAKIDSLGLITALSPGSTNILAIYDNVASNISPLIINPNQDTTVAYYSFNDNSGNVAIDSSGNGFNGTIFNSSWIIGKIGSALRFDSNTRYVEVPVLGDAFTNGQITIEAWIKFDVFDSNTTYQIIGDQIYGLKFLTLKIDSSKLKLYIGTYTSLLITSCKYPFLSNEWYYIAVTYDGTNGKSYINAVLENQNPVVQPIPKAYNKLYIGSKYTYGDNFTGIIDEMRISKIAKSQISIGSYYNYYK